MNITLRAGERLYINGAVIRVDRKATIELLNDVTFLLENHVMQADQATTPLRQIYFAVQVMLMDPGRDGGGDDAVAATDGIGAAGVREPADRRRPESDRRADRPRAQFRGAEGAESAVSA